MQAREQSPSSTASIRNLASGDRRQTASLDDDRRFGLQHVSVVLARVMARLAERVSS